MSSNNWQLGNAIFNMSFKGFFCPHFQKERLHAFYYCYNSSKHPVRGNIDKIRKNLNYYFLSNN